MKDFGTSLLTHGKKAYNHGMNLAKRTVQSLYDHGMSVADIQDQTGYGLLNIQQWIAEHIEQDNEGYDLAEEM